MGEIRGIGVYLHPAQSATHPQPSQLKLGEELLLHTMTDEVCPLFRFLVDGIPLQVAFCVCVTENGGGVLE
jgi:hypothetical protein